MRFFALRAVAAAFFIVSVQVSARAATPAPSPSPVPQIAHVYTSDRTGETAGNVARTTYVVTRDQIERHGYRTIGEAIANLPGVDVFAYGAIGAAANFGVRGSSSAQTLVLVDGLPAPGSFANSVEIDTLPTTGVERIEVVEGGGSALFGTGAIGGIVNIITQGRARDSATVRAGSFGERAIELQAGPIQFSRLVAGNAFPLPVGARPDADYETSAIHMDASARLLGFDAAFRAGFESDHAGAAGPDGFLSLSSREDDLNADANVTLTRKSARSEFTVQAGGTEQRIAFGCDAVNDPNCFQAVPSLNTEGRVDLGARNVVRSDRGRLLYGIDLSRGSVRADAGGAYSTNPFAQSAAFAQQTFEGLWGSAYAGVRGERDGALGGELSPALGFAVRLSANTALKGNAATAFRAPNATELYFPGYGNPNLHPERAQVADLTFVDDAFAGGASIGWFENRTNDLIVPVLVDPANFVYAPENIDHAAIEGLTLQIRTPTRRGMNAHLGVTDLYRAQNVDTGSRLPGDPVLSSELGIDYKGTGVLDAAGVALRSAGARGAVNPEQPVFDQPIACTTADAYLRLRLSATIAATLRAMNFGNERYASVGGFPMPGRWYEIELTAR